MVPRAPETWDEKIFTLGESAVNVTIYQNGTIVSEKLLNTKVKET